MFLGVVLTATGLPNNFGFSIQHLDTFVFGAEAQTTGHFIDALALM